jgi:hypothetical protein
MARTRLIFATSFSVLLLCSLPVTAAPASTRPSPRCVIGIINKSCTLTIDRRYPVSPPTIQMYSKAQLTVKVTHALPFEDYSLDTVPGTATLVPDAYAAFLQGQGILANISQLATSASEKLNDFVPKTTLGTRRARPANPCDDKPRALRLALQSGHSKALNSAYANFNGSS